MKKCPSCEREWDANCEQAVCVDLHDECIVCRFTPSGSNVGTIPEMKAIVDESEKRKSNVLVKLRPEAEVSYTREDDRIVRVSLDGFNEGKLEFQVPSDMSGDCLVFINGRDSRYEKQGLKDLCIAWLALVAPEVLKFDD